MIQVWQDIIPAEAEARMRGLVRRLAELDEALKACQQMRADYPDSFSAELSLDSLTHLQTRLEAERLELVRHRQRERVTVALQGHEFADHTAGLGELGVFLIRLQKLFSSIAQAITTGPTRRGPISHDIANATTMRFAAAFPSSFGIELYINQRYDVFGESTATSTLQALFNLLSASKREQEISRLSAELGQRAVGHLRHVLSDLSRSQSGFRVAWTDVAGTEFSWAAESDEIPQIHRNVSRFRTSQIVEVRVRGLLIGASLLRDRFELLQADQTVVEGKVTRAVKPRLRDFFGRPCTVTLEKVEVVETVSDERKIYFTLTGIEAADAQAR